jgi:hypothetical protein
MASSHIIGRWAALLLAEVLNLSATVAEKILSGQPRWIAQLRLLEANLRPPAGGSQDTAEGEGEAPAADTTRQMLESYAILSRTLKDIEARGLALDGALVERMKCDWSPKSIVGYLVTCDARLKQEIGEALNAAAGAIGPASAAAGDHGEAKRKGRVS